MDIFPHHSRPCHCMFSTFFIQCRPYTLLQRQFSNLKWCRSFKVCSVLEAIKAFGWICWGLFTILLVVTLIKLLLGGDTRTTRSEHRPDTRQINVHDQPPRTQVTQPVENKRSAQEATETV